MKSLKRKTATSVRLRRRNNFLVHFVRKYEPRCLFCMKLLREEDFTDYRDGITEHHIDSNRSNNSISNLVLVHRGCHISYHKNVRKLLNQIVEQTKQKETQNVDKKEGMETVAGDCCRLG